jgi:hypothetical protein
MYNELKQVFNENHSIPDSRGIIGLEVKVDTKGVRTREVI